MPEKNERVETGGISADPERKLAELICSRRLPFCSLTSVPVKEGEVKLELTLYLPEHLTAVEELLKGEFDLCQDLFHSNNGWDLFSLEYRFVTDGVPVILNVNTIFGHAFSSAVSHMDSVNVSSEAKEYLREQVLNLERSFAHMSSGAGRKEDAIWDNKVVPGQVKTLAYEEDLINASEVMLYFQIHPSTLERWTSLAEENGLIVLRDPVNADSRTAPPRGLVPLMDTFRRLRIRDLLDLKEYLSRNLERWEDLYEAFEIARLKGLFTSEKVTPFEFALALIEARKD